MQRKKTILLIASLLALAASSLGTQAQLLWTVGQKDGAWPVGDGGGARATFVQENGSISELPGDPANPETNGQADNDYYLAGTYTNVIASVAALYGDYTPVGEVLANEEAAERAFAGGDLDMRYHFNLPATLKTNDMLSVTYAAVNLDGVTEVNTDPRFGIAVLFNGLPIQSENIIRATELGIDYMTAQFSLASVNAQVGPGFDNIVSLKGISYNSDGGGNWMGIDYVKLEAKVLHPTNEPAALPLLLTIGLDDEGWPVGDGGAGKATFVQENGAINDLPGSPTSPETNAQADNDYYFAGSYTTAIPSVVAMYGDYTPVGTVAANEEAAERAFAAADNDLRYHFNLPTTLKPFDLLSVTFDAYNLDALSDVNTSPRYGVEVYFNGVLVQPQILVSPVDLGTDYTTAQFRLDSVNAQVGPGFDNIVSLKGTNYNTDGGGNWMGIDYVQVNAGPSSLPPDTAAPTVVSVARYGDGSRLSVTFSEPITTVTANVAANYLLSSGGTVTGATLQTDRKTVVLITSPIALGASDTLTVSEVKDIAGNTIGATGNKVTFTSKNQVLFVTADPGPLTFAGDQAVLQHLQARGYDVTLTTGTDVPADGSTGIGKDLVIVSSSLGSGTVAAKFRGLPVPVIEWEAALEDEFGFQELGGNTTDAQTDINIVDASHPLAAGFPAGVLTVTTSPQIFSQGTPVGAHVVATIAGDPTLALLYAYEKGDKGFNGFAMPARRVFFFLQDLTASALNAAGFKLFDAALDYAMRPLTGSTNAPTLPLIWTVGMDDNAQPAGDGGGANATFVQENGSINALPGVPDSAEVNQQADNDYYFAGTYSTAIPSVIAMYGDYTPLGVVAEDEEAAERAYAGADNDLRYHFNLPTSLKTTDALSVTFDMVSLETGKADTRYGVAVYFNGVLVQPEILIRPAQLDADYTTPEFSLASVDAKTGPGFDNVVSLKGFNYSADGGGNWMGLDYVQLNGGTPTAPTPGPVFLPAILSAGKIVLAWTGVGALEASPAVTGPWTAITPPPTSPYSENVSGEKRFYRLKKP